MLVSYTKNFIFFRTKKTAGTTIEMYFQKYCLPPDVELSETCTESVTEYGIVGSRATKVNMFYDHIPVFKLKQQMSADKFDNYFKFCSIRNPYEKAVSRFWWEIDYNPILRHLKFDPNIPFSEIQQKFQTFVNFPKWLTDDRDAYTNPNGTIAVNDFIRYENLKEDMKRICNTLNIEFNESQIGQYKSESRVRLEPYQAYYTEDTYNFVTKHIQVELDTFGYKF